MVNGRVWVCVSGMVSGRVWSCVSGTVSGRGCACVSGMVCVCGMVSGRVWMCVGGMVSERVCVCVCVRISVSKWFISVYVSWFDEQFLLRSSPSSVFVSFSSNSFNAILGAVFIGLALFSSNEHSHDR